MAALGLRVKSMPPDGNCLFHSLVDQLYGEDGGGDAADLRRRVVDHIAAHRDAFEPFVEDDEKFDDYVRRMREDGTWAGNLELQAASQVLGRNLRIFQAGQPPWVVMTNPEVRTPRCVPAPSRSA